MKNPIIKLGLTISFLAILVSGVALMVLAIDDDRQSKSLARFYQLSQGCYLLHETYDHKKHPKQLVYNCDGRELIWTR